MGTGQVIKALDEGIALMHKGEKVKFFILINLAYGDQGHALQFRQKSDLIFDVEVLDVLPVVVPAQFDITDIEAKKTASGLQYYET